MKGKLSSIPGLQKLFDYPFYTEGPVIDSEGTIFCTSLIGRRVLSLSANHVVSEWAAAACPNGQAILQGGDHLICDSGNASINRFNREGNFTGYEMKGSCDNTEVFVPNDLVIGSEAGIYFTDSVRKSGRVFYIGSNGKENTLASGLDYPNGLVLSRDEKRLFVAESYRNRILVINLKSPGVADGLPEVFCILPFHESGREADNLPDGLALDDHSNIWVAHYGMQALQVIAPTGLLLNSFDTGLPLTSNIFIKDNLAIITGGFGEPGPGAVLTCSIENVINSHEA